MLNSPTLLQEDGEDTQPSEEQEEASEEETTEEEASEEELLEAEEPHSMDKLLRNSLTSPSVVSATTSIPVTRVSDF